MPKRFLSDGEQAQEPRRSGRRSGGRTSASESLEVGGVELEAAILRRNKEAELETARRIAALKQREIDLQIDLAEKELEVEQARAAEELASASSARAARSSAVDTSSSEPESSELESEDVDGGSWPRGVGSRRARSDAEAKRRLANHFSRSAFSDAGAGAVAHRRPGSEQGSGSQPAQQPMHPNMQQPVQPAVQPNTSAPVQRASLLKYRPAPTPAPRAKPRRLPAKPVPSVPLRLGPVQQAFKPKGAGPSPPPKPVPPVPLRLRPVQQAFKPKEAGLNPAAEPYFPPTRATDPAVDWADGAAMFQMGVCRSLKPLDLPKFDGKMLSYVKWRQRFLRLVHENPLLSEDYKLAHLREALADGAAEDLIADVLDGPGAYSAIMEELDRWYGGTDRSLEQQERELMSWPRINTERELDELKTLAVKLRNTLLNLRVARIAPGRELYLSVTQKVPRSVLSAYFEKQDDTQCDIDAFAAFLLKRVHKLTRVNERIAASEPASARRVVQSQKPCPPSVAPKRPPRSGDFTFAVGPDQCASCKGTHHLSACPRFKSLTVQQRWEFVRACKDICSCCLSPGHWSTACKMSCGACQRRHHALLHSDRPKRDAPGGTKPTKPAPAERHGRHTAHVTVDASTESCTEAHTTHVMSALDTAMATAERREEDKPPEALPLSFMTVPVVLSHNGRRVQGTALLDPASSTSYIRQQTASAIGVCGPRKQLTASVLGGGQVTGTYEHVTVAVDKADGSISEFRAWALPTVCPSVQPVDWSQSKQSWEHLRDIPFPSVEGRIDVLIGLNAIELHTVRQEATTAQPNHPIARLTPLGWVCLSPGRADLAPASFSAVVTPTSEDLSLETLVRNHLCMESAGARPPCYDAMPSAEDSQVEERTNATARFVDGRVELGIPWVDPEPHISSNRPQAAQRLRSLERSLNSRPRVQQQYHDVMQSHLDKGYIREVPSREVDADGAQQWFLPHFPVVRNDKETTKVRIVFDAAAKWDGRSINDEMFSGPALQTDIVKVLIRFCAEPVALVADISEMFLQVALREEDRKYHRFLWRFDDNQPRVYEFQRVVFGIKASPYLAGKAVQEVLRRFGPQYSAAITDALERSRYVDDLLTSRPSVADAVESRVQFQDILSRGGFHLRKWLSTSAEVLQSIPAADRAASATLNVGEHIHCTLPTTKTLGVTWSADKDVFSFHFKRPEFTKLTRRSVLSGLASAFDPRGQIAPFTIRARVLLQDTWLLDQAWDDELPPTHARKWREWFDELPDLAAINAPRSFKAATESILSVHTFTDASDRAIAAATYIRAEDAAGNVRVTLAMAKAKTAPARRQTIPQLELRGAVLGLRTSSEVGNALDIPVAEHTFWTDSMNVLGWIRSHSRRFKVDIGNRVSELQNATKPSQWRHVPGKQNPADKGTRGLPAKELAEDRVWWHGPAFLSQQPDVWPPEKSASTEGLPGVIQRETTFTLAVTPTTRLQASRYRTWEQLLRVTAWCYRFVSRCRRKPRVGMKGEDTSSDQDVTVAVSTSRAANSNYPTVNVPELTAGEVGRAERHWIRQAQKDAYGPTLERLAAGKPMQASDPLAALTPTLDQHAEPLMVVGGRLKAAKHLPYRVRLPIILPQKHVVTRLLIEKEDRRCRHSVGPQHLLSNLRERFWIVNGASAVKTARQSCVPCRKNWGVPAAQIMGALPDFRTAGSLQPFSHCGIDFAGPFQTKQGRGRTRAKRYLCLMTCLETRACHLELTYSMDTGGFLMAFNRFVKRRGTPSIIVTDNGSNFVAAERELREAVEQLDRAEIARSLADRHIRWRFNPPRAPHFGGVFEAMIKAAKRALRSALATAELTDEELHTAIVAAEDLINSRPLTTVSADAADLEPLTPQHFLAGRCDPPLPLEEKLNATEQVHPRDRFAVVQRTVKEVWRRWLLEFVPLLNQRRKWRKTQKNIAVDEVVLCIEPDTPRGSWPLGRVRRVFPGPDSCVRVVDVEIRGKIYRRAIQRLIPLPVE
ncbi:uncharacterized protein LOC135813015 [Sycon ciliatum]|uniref:uncharacterized protein LOC135813015 n=1 Tax=Sycon ciliatum TaxID=27933 RepID=UPI0031F6139D